MKIKRLIVLGIFIWSMGILLYSLSFYLPILEDREMQANIVLFLAVIPLVWFGCRFYYKSNRQTHGYLVGQALLLIAVVLDTLITVPFFVIPNGGSHYNFFTDLGFWIIAIEFLVVAVLYWYVHVNTLLRSSKQ
jgi:hypothetical protein